MLDEAVSGFLQEGLSIHLGTRNERLEPSGARVSAVRVDDDGRHLLAYVPVAASRAVLADLRANGQAAMSFARPVDDRACQVKGTFVSVRDGTNAEEAFVRAQWGGFLRQLEAVGMPGASTASWQAWPCVVVRLQVTALFDQTPGPKAGAALP